MAVTDRLITADEFMTLDDENGVYLELVRGRLVRIVVPGVRHGMVTLRLISAVYEHVKSHRLGLALGRVSFKLESNPDTVRVPDFSFVVQNRVPDELPDTYFDGVPDLAGEVLCPTDSLTFMAEKVAQYLCRGARLVWVVDPGAETVTAYRPSAEPLILRRGDVLDGGEVIPGFACDIRRIFDQDWEA